MTTTELNNRKYVEYYDSYMDHYTRARDFVSAVRTGNVKPGALDEIEHHAVIARSAANRARTWKQEFEPDDAKTILMWNKRITELVKFENMVDEARREIARVFDRELKKLGK